MGDENGCKKEVLKDRRKKIRQKDARKDPKRCKKIARKGPNPKKICKKRDAKISKRNAK